MLSGRCVLVDRANGYIGIKYQVDINDTESIKDKLTFERDNHNQGLVIKGHQTDNGVFNES